jgi:hypothetical protein
MTARRDNREDHDTIYYRWVGEEIEEHDGDYKWRHREPTRQELAVESCRRLRRIGNGVWTIAWLMIASVVLSFLFGMTVSKSW